jgi:hypothetical protein
VKRFIRIHDEPAGVNVCVSLDDIASFTIDPVSGAVTLPVVNFGSVPVTMTETQLIQLLQWVEVAVPVPPAPPAAP